MDSMDTDSALPSTSGSRKRNSRDGGAASDTTELYTASSDDSDDTFIPEAKGRLRFHHDHRHRHRRRRQVCNNLTYRRTMSLRRVLLAQFGLHYHPHSLLQCHRINSREGVRQHQAIYLPKSSSSHSLIINITSPIEDGAGEFRLDGGARVYTQH
ncbi:hypothetical protein HPB50_002679 [Hyalomma asiaticum]|uniref:Uncharacterized protein n=1 Tax=Hyalomma asiaticum TaxID=266040 RepID=A0ACB7TDI0_HYAAI|nr:hypothetical protein HPB50_002679 [Hyalomma asiaticum]